MKVDRYIVYRIVPFDMDIKVGDFVSPTSKSIDSKYKLIIENALEEKRPSQFVKRSSCLYVCYSKENAYEWANIKYGRKNTSYKLLTLELTGDLFWFVSDFYNFLGDKYTQTQLDKACVDYWNSITENTNNLKLDKGFEGLFVGNVMVTAIEYKNYINGESVDII